MTQTASQGPQAVRHLREVMDSVGGWAHGWHDVEWFLETVAPHDARVSWHEAPTLIWEVKHLHRRGVPFTTDYRQIYKAITGVDCPLPEPPQPERFETLPLRQVAEKWLDGLRFPATPEEAVERARHHHAPADVIAALRELSEPSYPSVGVLVQRLCEHRRARR